MNRKIQYIGLSILGATSLLLWGWTRGRNAVDYQTAQVTKGSLESSISATGTCNAVVTVQVGSQVSGNIKALYADFNTKVKKDQLVALIDPELFQARVSQAQANLDATRAAVVSAEAQVRRAQADVASAQANSENLKAAIARTKVAVLDAKSKLARRMDLFQQGILSSEDRDTAQAAYDSAVAEQSSAQAMYNASLQMTQSAQAQVEVARTQVSTAQAQVKQLSAALHQVQVDLEHTRITAPVDGTVVARRMDVGQTVAASFQAPTIFEIAQDLTKMQVDTSIDEADIGRVRVEQSATFNVDAYPGRTFSGQVMQIRKAPINVQNVITYDAVVAVPNLDLKLFPGMTANVRVLTDRHESVLKIPNSALRVSLGADKAQQPAQARGTASGGPRGAHRQQPGSTIYVLKDGKPVPAHVQLGISDGQYTEVSGEIGEGDAVVVAVNQKNQSAAARSAQQQQPRRGPGF
jgi:HlyD family secretion protein